MKELQEFMDNVKPVSEQEVKKAAEKPKTSQISSNSYSVTTNYFLGVGTVVESLWECDDNRGKYSYFMIQFDRNLPDTVKCRVRDKRGMAFVQTLELGTILEVTGKLRYDKSTRESYVETKTIIQDPINNGDFVNMRTLLDKQAGHVVK